MAVNEAPIAHRRTPTPRRCLPVLAGAVVVARSACTPVVADHADTTPPTITWRLDGAVVAGGSTVHVSPAGVEVMLVGHDHGGMDVLEFAPENHITCTAGSVSQDQTDVNPQWLRGYDYSLDQHVYFGHRIAPDDFWPDVNHDGIEQTRERRLRYDDLVLGFARADVAIAVTIDAVGTACLLQDGTTPGTVTRSNVVLTASAQNARSEVSGLTSQTTTTSTVTLTL